MNIFTSSNLNDATINLTDYQDLNDNVFPNEQQDLLNTNITSTDYSSAQEDDSYSSIDSILSFSVPAIALGVTMAIAVFYNPWDYL